MLKWLAWGHLPPALALSDYVKRAYPSQNLCLAHFAFLKLSLDLLLVLCALVTTYLAFLFLLISLSLMLKRGQHLHVIQTRKRLGTMNLGDPFPMQPPSEGVSRRCCWSQGSRETTKLQSRFSSKKKKVLKTNENVWSSPNHKREAQVCQASCFPIGQM